MDIFPSEMNYESPISMYTERMEQDVITNQEELVMNEVLRLGVAVNKEELEKALKYDRDQYKKGYRDGIIVGRMVGRWIPTSETMPDVGETVLANDCPYCHQELVLTDNAYYEHDNQIVLARGGWTLLAIGVDEDENTVMRACGDGYTSDYHPKYCPECGRCLTRDKLRKDVM